MKIARLTRQSFQEMCGQQRNILFAIAQRRNAQVDDAQSVIEILTKTALLDHCRQITIGRREDAHIDRDAMRRAYGTNFFLLQSAQQFSLQSSGSSPISSRNTVPPCAEASRPSFARLAPVNAPFT